VSQPTINPARTRLTRGLSEPGWVQLTFEKVEFFSTQPGSNPWWAGLAHGLKPILTSLARTYSRVPKLVKWLLLVYHLTMWIGLLGDRHKPEVLECVVPTGVW